MRTLATATFAVLAAATAMAQYKSPAAPPKSTSPIQTSALQIPAPDKSLESAKRISQDEAMEMIKEGKAVYVDVRIKPDYDAGHIKGAINIPLPELQSRWRDLPVKKYLITYCA